MTTDDRSVIFYDAYVPHLTGGEYTIEVHQEVRDDNTPLSHPGQSNDDFPLLKQGFWVQAPRFSLEPSFVHSVQPPPGSVGNYDNHMPHVSLARPSLPWEQEMGPEGKENDAFGNRIPSLALLLFSENELVKDPQAQGKIDTTSVSDLIALRENNDPATWGPNIHRGTVAPAVLASTCSTIDVYSDVFHALAPSTEEMALLTHVRQVTETPTRRMLAQKDLAHDLGTYSVVVANRFPHTRGTYAAHLVSLEGFFDDLKPGAPKPPRDTVRLVSLHAWSFTSTDDEAGHFSYLASNVARPAVPAEHAGCGLPEALSLRLQPPSARGDGPEDAFKEVCDRLTWGYAPLSYLTADGECTLGWYRGPLSPVPSSTVPGLSAASDVEAATLRPGGAWSVKHSSPDSLLVYAPQWGMFDVSYAAAWTMGRLMALSHAPARAAQKEMWQRARSTAARALTRLASSAQASGLDVEALRTKEALAQQHAPVERFHQLLAGDLAQRLRRVPPTSVESVHARAGAAQSAARQIRSLMERSEVRALLADALAEPAEPFADVFEALSALELVSFDHLVPDARMVPKESVRFFYVDPVWMAALVNGFVSAGVQTTLDQALVEPVTAAVAGRLGSRPGGGNPPQAGLLLRSRLAHDWPGLIIDAYESDENSPLVEVVRRENLAPDLLLCLFDKVPGTVVFHEPHQDLYFGAIELKEGGQPGLFIDLRDLNDDASVGKPLDPVQYFPDPNSEPRGFLDYFRSGQPPNETHQVPVEVLDVSKVKPALQTALQRTGLSPGQFAIEMIKSPVRQPFFFQ